MNVLECKGITKRFGGLVAVRNFDLEVRPGEIRSLIGPNGAGKTTLFNCITGYLKPDKGKVLFEGIDITGERPERIVRRGLVRTFQITSIFPNLTVYENIRIAIQSRRERGIGFSYPHEYYEEVTEILREVGISKEESNMLACNLSHGKQRSLEIGIALALKPKLLLLDEPTAGMSPTETMQMMNLIRHVREHFGCSILLIEHDMRVVRGISDVVTVMHLGEKIAEGTPEEVRRNEAVRRVYLGT